MALRVQPPPHPPSPITASSLRCSQDAEPVLLRDSPHLLPQAHPPYRLPCGPLSTGHHVCYSDDELLHRACRLHFRGGRLTLHAGKTVFCYAKGRAAAPGRPPQGRPGSSKPRPQWRVTLSAAPADTLGERQERAQEGTEERAGRSPVSQAPGGLAAALQPSSRAGGRDGEQGPGRWAVTPRRGGGALPWWRPAPLRRAGAAGRQAGAEDSTRSCGSSSSRPRLRVSR